MRPLGNLIALCSAAGLLGACASAPDTLGYANASNIAAQALDPVPDAKPRASQAGGEGGRAGVAVDMLRKRAAKGSESR